MLHNYKSIRGKFGTSELHHFLGFSFPFKINTSSYSPSYIQQKHHYGHFNHCRNIVTNGLIFDIDGVLLHHQNALPRAKESLEMLYKKNIPFIFLTNNGGKTEVERAKAIQRHLDLSFEIDPSILVMSHTPMIEEAAKFENEYVLVCGHGDIDQIAAGLGLKKAISVDTFLSHNHEIYPSWNSFERDVLNRRIQISENLHYSNIQFKAVFVLHDSFFVMRDLQLLMDILRSNGTIGQDSISHQDVPLYMSHADFLYSSSLKWPRFGQGAFKLCLQSTYKQLTGRELNIIQYGKPEKRTYDFAHKRLIEVANRLGYLYVHHAYCIGDNPAADVKGANNAGSFFTSVLVRTGVFQGTENDTENPADIVVDDVGDFILDKYISKHHI